LSPQNTELLNDRLAAALSHPTRMFAMNVLWQREASPREIARELGEPLNNVTYHVNQLRDLGWIELIAQRPARGGRVVEHFYRATSSSHIDDAEWELLGDKEKLQMDRTIIGLMSRDVSEAILSGSFFERDDNHLTRIPIEVDSEGWEETKQILDRALEELMTVQETVANRAAESGEETISTKVEILHFLSPPPRAGDDD
jgi:DNA-binding transcriptional ArsR family regulator